MGGVLVTMQQQWWQKSVVYQVWPRSFVDDDGDGIGDLAGTASRLDYLAALGVDVLWLSPIYPSSQDDAGYDISDYQDIDPTFGSMEQFDALLAAVHEREMKLIMDLVVNHTSDEHPWFVESRASKDNPKRDWYWWRPAREGMNAGAPGAEPNNWGSIFSGPAWELDDNTGEYYLHLFSRKQPDSHVRNGSLYGDGMPFFVDGPRIHEFLQEMHREVFAGREGLITVGEMPGVTVEEAKLYTDPTRREVDLVFQFEHVQVDHGETRWDVRPLRLGDLKAVLGRAGRPVWPRLAGTAFTGTTMTSRASSRASATTERTACAPRSCSAPCCTCTAGRPTSTRAKSSA